MLDKLRSGVVSLGSVFQMIRGRGPGETSPEQPLEIQCPQARMTIRQVDAEVHLVSDFQTSPLVRLKGLLAGSGTTVKSQISGREAVILIFPVDLGGERRRLSLTALISPSADTLELSRSTRRLVPPQEQAVEVTFSGHGDRQARYLLEMPVDVELAEFREFSKAQAVFEEVPPVSQMVAFLKATIHQRRTTLRSLVAMSRRSPRPEVQEITALLERELSSAHDFTNPGIEAARGLLERKGRTVYPNTVAALCLLADIGLGQLTEVEVRNLVDRDVPLTTSYEAARAVVGFLGVKTGNSDWKKVLPKKQKPPNPKRAEEGEAFLRQTLGQRNALSTLQDLADDSGSERSRTRVTRLLDRVPAHQVLVNDEHQALRQYLNGTGRQVQPDTVAALGIYVDFEAGILTEDDIDSLTPQRGFWDTSLYGMLAISGAFDAQLRAFRLPDPLRNAGPLDSLVRRRATDDWWSQLTALTRISQGGLVARFLELGQQGYTTCYLGSEEDVLSCRRRGLRFTGQILARLPMLEHLHEADLKVLAQAGQPMLAMFGSEERTYQWRRWPESRQSGSLDGLLKSDCGFLDGYEVFAFHDRVVAQRAPVSCEDLVGRTGVLAIFKDHRGNAHYHYLQAVNSPQDLQPPRPDLEWSGEIVTFPDLSGCPDTLLEPSHDFLLGRPDDRSLTRARLNRVYLGMRDCLLGRRPLESLRHYPNHRRRLLEGLSASWLRSLLLGTVEIGTRNRLIAMVRDDEVDLRLNPSLLAALDLTELVEFAVLTCLHQLCRQPEVSLEHRKFYQAAPFLDLLLDRLYTACDSADPAIRILAARLLACDLAVGDEQRQLAASYVLSRMFDHDKPAVARAAAAALAALALQPCLPTPHLVVAEPTTVGTRPQPTHTDESAELKAGVETFLQRPPTPATAAAWSALHQDRGRVEATVSRMADLNRAFRRDGSLDTVRYLLCVEPGLADQAVRCARECWESFLTHHPVSGQDRVQLRQGYLEQLPELRSTTTASGRLRHDVLPYLGGITGAVDVCRLPAGCNCSPEPGGPGFAWFLALAAGSAHPDLVILRYLPGEDADEHPEGRHEEALHPHDMLFFDSGAGRFAAWLESDASRPLALVAASLPEAVGAGGCESKPEDHEEPPGLLELVDSVRSTFNLPPEHHKLVLNILAGLDAEGAFASAGANLGSPPTASPEQP